jgi:tRNA (mo5U34)-methyltransferase
MTQTLDRVPPTPPGFEYELLVRGCAYWHQRWEVFRGVYTPGNNPVEEMLDAMQVPKDLTGKRVLDVGSWNGCAAFECERRGASEVLALGPENPHLMGFNLLHDLTGSTRTRYEHGTCYHLDPEKIGTFDVVLFCGVLYHLRYPLLGLDNVRRVCRGEIYVDTFVSDSDLCQSIGPDVSTLPLWQFYRRGELSADESNWFGPTACAVAQALESAGFSVQHATKWISKRAALRAAVKIGLPEFLTLRSVEAIYYDSIVEPLFGSIQTWDLPPAKLSLFGRTPAPFHIDPQSFVERRQQDHVAPPPTLWTRMRRKLRPERRAA